MTTGATFARTVTTAEQVETHCLRLFCQIEISAVLAVHRVSGFLYLILPLALFIAKVLTTGAEKVPVANIFTV